MHTDKGSIRRVRWRSFPPNGENVPSIHSATRTPSLAFRLSACSAAERSHTNLYGPGNTLQHRLLTGVRILHRNEKLLRGAFPLGRCEPHRCPLLHLRFTQLVLSLPGHSSGAASTRSNATQRPQPARAIRSFVCFGEEGPTLFFSTTFIFYLFDRSTNKEAYIFLGIF